MPRPPRLHVPGGVYHVTLRGNHREVLFGTDADRRVLNQITAEAMRQLGARIHAFCWMTNHIHALIQIADRPLGRVVQRIAMRYSRYRHRLMRTTGHLFERRHTAKLVEVDAYFLTLLRYIHLNPVKAGMVSRAAEYPWSSHRAYLGTEVIPWLSTDFGLSLFAAERGAASHAYARFIQQPDDDELEEIVQGTHPRDSRVLGSDSFLAGIPAGIPAEPYRPESTITLEDLAAQICDRRGIDVALLCSLSRARHLTPARLELAHQATALRVATVAEVARFLHREPSALIQLLARYRQNGQ